MYTNSISVRNFRFPSGKTAGFSLVELLTVVALFALLATGVVAMMDSSTGKFRNGLAKTADMMIAAHQWAVAERTYVYVIFSNPDPATGTSYAAVVASKNGLDIAPFNSSSAPTQGSDFELLTKVEKFENIGFLQQTPSGSVVSGPQAEKLNEGAATFRFTNLPDIEFERFFKVTPRGEVLVGPSLVERVQVVLQPRRGTESSNPERSSLVQISGLTGKVSVYQP